MNESIRNKILEANLQNIARKVAQGKTLTSAERALIESENTENDLPKQYADTIVDLADILGVDRRTIDNWRKMKGSPKPTSNGKHSVSKCGIL